jgi:XisI protein
MEHIIVDQLSEYGTVIRRLIEEHAQIKPAVGEIEVEAIFDEVKDHYELIYSGWSGDYRIHGSVLHVDIRNGKIYSQHDGTEEGIANQLVAAGVPHNRIVLAFKPPEIRPYTEFATA